MKQQAIDLAKTLPGNVIARAMNKTIRLGMNFTGSTKKALLYLLVDGKEYGRKIKDENYFELHKELQSEQDAITATKKKTEELKFRNGDTIFVPSYEANFVFSDIVTSISDGYINTKLSGRIRFKNVYTSNVDAALELVNDAKKRLERAKEAHKKALNESKP